MADLKFDVLSFVVVNFDFDSGNIATDQWKKMNEKKTSIIIIITIIIIIN